MRNLRLLPAAGVFAAALVAIAAALALPFAPVVTDRTVVSWPKGSGPATSSMALLAPYRPATLDLRFTCAAVTTIADGAVDRERDGATDRERVVFATLPPDYSWARDRGLLVVVDRGRLRVFTAGQELAAEPVRTGPCTYHLTAGAHGMRLDRDGGPVAGAAVPVPEVTAFVTHGEGTLSASDLRVEVTAEDRFVARPTTTKRWLLAATLAGAGAGILLLLVLDGRRRPGTKTRAGPGPTAADALVTGVLGLWWLVGPVNADDGWYATMARNAADAGFIGNYYRWFNAPEAPFTLVQQAMAALFEPTAEPVWLRLPALAAGLASWPLISRGMLGPLFARRGARWVIAACFLLWWLPFGLSTRAEPFGSLAVVAVFVLLHRATTNDRVLPVGLAAAVAPLALTTSFTGLVAWLPFMVFGPALVRMLARRRPVEIAAIAAGVLGAGTAAVPVIFIDQSIRTVAAATGLHTQMGPFYRWHEEFNRYGSLLAFSYTGNYGHRAPVLLTLALLAFGGYLVAVRAVRSRVMRLCPLLPKLLLATALGFVALALTPTKIIFHLGVLAGLGAATAAGVVCCAWQVRDAPALRPARAAPIAAGLALVGALGFAGPNDWWYYSNVGQPWPTPPPALFGLALSAPAAWIAAAVGAVGAVAVARRSRRAVAGAVRAMPPAVAFVIAALTVSLLVVSFTGATYTARHGWSFGKTNMTALVRDSCGMADGLVVDVDRPGGVLAPVAARASLEDSTFGFQRGYLPSHPPPSHGGMNRYLWGTFPEPAIGSFSTPWFRLGTVAAADSVYISVAGRVSRDSTLAVELAGSEGAVPLVALPVRDVADTPDWRPVRIIDGAAIPAAADSLRLVARDGSVGLGGWLAFTGPRLATSQRLTSVVGRTPVLVDWPLAFAFPCARLPRIAAGLVEPPGFIVLRPPMQPQVPEPAGIGGLGGTFYGAAIAGHYRELPSRLDGAPDYSWGRLVQISYPYAVDGIDVRVERAGIHSRSRDSR